MASVQTIQLLTAHPDRGAGTDAERRAAGGLAKQLTEELVTTVKSGEREIDVEPFWCRPNWAATHAWHTALALAGSLVTTGEARIGGVLLLIALLSVMADSFTGLSAGRRLTFEHASQNVVATRTDGGDRVHLIVTAHYDAGRAGLIFREPLRAAAATLARATGRAFPGWLGWIAIAIVCLLVTALLRLGGHGGAGVAVLQLLPTIGLVLALALLLDQATAGYGPAANDNASGVSAAIALTKALDVAPPARLAVDLVLGGAGDGGAIGLRRYLHRRKELKAPNTVVIGVGACGAGNLRWWVSDGPLVPQRYFKGLRELSSGVASDEPHLNAGPHRGRGTMPALPARTQRLPAISIGCLDERGLAPRSHQTGDGPDLIDPAGMDTTVYFGLLLVDAIDALVREREATPARA